MPDETAVTRTKEEHFHDVQGRSYTCDLTNPLGSGGQGMVLRVRDDIYSAVKIECVNKIPCRDERSREAFQRKVLALRRLPIPADCRVSLPVALLRDVSGYVMRLLGKMRPLNEMIPRRSPGLLTADGMPQWILGICEEDEYTRKHIHFYSRSGGLRTRLHILLQLAETLAALHGEGLLFGDISPNNVLIGSTGEVWMIDTDNIAYDGRSSTLIYTPGYGPPEIVCGKAKVSIAGDAYSFALLAFETLTMLHPFHDGSAGDEDMDAEERADRGELPWICDHADDGNRGGPLEFLAWNLTPRLFRLFSAMFEKGRSSPVDRPQLWMFRDALAQALDTCIRCPACGMGVVYAECSEHACMFCDATYPQILVAEVGEYTVFAHELEAAFAAPWRIFGALKRDGHALRFTWAEDKLCIFPGGKAGDISYSLEESSFEACPEVLEISLNIAERGVRFALRDARSRPVIIRLREA